MKIPLLRIASLVVTVDNVLRTQWNHCTAGNRQNRSEYRLQRIRSSGCIQVCLSLTDGERVIAPNTLRFPQVVTRIEQPVTGTDGGLVAQTIGPTKPRRKVLRVRIDDTAADVGGRSVNRVDTVPDELTGVKIKGAQFVVAVDWPAQVVVAQAHIDCQLLRDLPVILNVCAVVVLAHNRGRVSNIPQSRVRQTQQIGRHGLAGGADVLRVRGWILVEVEVSRKQAVVQILHVAEVPTCFYQMPAGVPGDATGEAIGVIWKREPILTWVSVTVYGEVWEQRHTLFLWRHTRNLVGIDKRRSRRQATRGAVSNLNIVPVVSEPDVGDGVWPERVGIRNHRVGEGIHQSIDGSGQAARIR